MQYVPEALEHDALFVLQRMTSFMALNDPALLVATASAVGHDSVIDLLR